MDGNWGGLVDAKNNIFDGMIGMLQRKVITIFIINLHFVFNSKVL